MKKCAALFLTFVMIFTMLPSYADVELDQNAAGISAENAEPLQNADAVSVTISAQKDGAFLFNRGNVEVKDGIAEQYGYTVAQKDHNEVEVDKPTVFDALVAAHIAKYGDSFTEGTAKNYLDISNGIVKKAFGSDMSSSGFFVNGLMPDDGIVNPSYGTATGYLADTARIKNNDNIELFAYQDMYWADYYTFFDETEKNVIAGEPFTLTLKGFMAMSAMGAKPAAKNINGKDGYITLNTVNADGSLSEAIKDENGEEILIDENGSATLTFDKDGEYIVTANGMEGDKNSPIIAPWCKVTVTSPAPPESITIVCDDKRLVEGNIFLTKKDDVFNFKAVDQNGDETPVTWSTPSRWTGTIDADTGEFKTTTSFGIGSTSYAEIEAASKIDENIKATQKYSLTGYMISDYDKNKEVVLSKDGQSPKNISIAGGYNGHTEWTCENTDGVAKLTSDLSKKDNRIYFDILRPGTFNVSFKLDYGDEFADSTTVTVKGVAVEDDNGKQVKTYLTKTAHNPNPTVKLNAYTGKDLTVSEWSSSDENIALVDENGVVTANSIGTAIITAKDSAGNEGGIKVVVESAEMPCFESFEFTTMAFASGTWETGKTYKPDVFEYDLPIKNYSTSSIAINNTTVYNTEKYIATAKYTDVNGIEQNINIANAKLTTLPNQPFGNSQIIITIADKQNADIKTEYKFNVTRPRDTTKAVKSISLVPAGREISGMLFGGIQEGTMQKADKDGNLTSGTGVSANDLYYRTFIYNNVSAYKLNIAASTNYAHIRYSADNGSTWKEIGQQSGVTDSIEIKDETCDEIIIQIIDDNTYYENTQNGKDGFADSECAEYKVWVDKNELGGAVIKNAQLSEGDWYPAFSGDLYTYSIVVKKGAAPVLTYTVSDNCTVKIGSDEQTPDESGVYTLELATSAKSITVSSNDGKYTNTYKFSYKEKSAFDVPDKVTDYLCMGSQYTNGGGWGGYGINPESTLYGTLKSLGNFGGYITYYYENPIVDNPNNKYGMDFYVLGNSSESNIDSMAELGQVYVSEDGNKWYALAGSEHYEDNAHWNYEITYIKGADGKSYWTDNMGNKMANTAVTWPKSSLYYMNDVANQDTYIYKGVLFESRQGSVMGDSTTASFAAKAKFGYADYYANNTEGTDVNSYVENPSKANGFDVEWAVDENGIPVDVKDMKFHYIKVATASNIWAGAFNEKSTEVKCVVRTTAQQQAVGRTDGIEGVTISDGAQTKIVNFTDGSSIYSLDIGDMKYVSVSPNGAKEDDNVYVNNQRVTYGGSASGFKITKEDGEKLVRIIVQNGDKEPKIYMLKLTGTASESGDLIEKVNINVEGSPRVAKTDDGINYTASVGYRINSIGIAPVASDSVKITVNGEELKESYLLKTGKNTFEITGEKDGIIHTVTLVVEKDSAPASTGKIKVYFSLLGDDIHGESKQSHTLKDNNLKTWIPLTAYEVDSPATVLDVFEKALKDKYTFKNPGGNYITDIDGLAEFTNGSLSGWMYTLNGKHSSLGVAEQKVSNGDKIVYHYTDDYTVEQGSEKWNKKSDTVSGLKSDGKTDTDNKDNTKTDETTPSTDGKYQDVKQDDWYFNAVKYVTDNGIMNGVSQNDFAPDEKLTRAMFATILYRIENSPETGKTAFADIPDGEWYSSAVAWANANKIVNGITDTEFAPNDSITREQMAVMIYRYARFKNYDMGEKGEISSYSDYSEISDYARDALASISAKGILTGKSSTTLNPLDNATRAETATVIMRMIEKFAA